MDRVQGVRWVSLKGQGGDCGGAQRDKDPGELAGDIGRAVVRRGERKGKVEPLTGGACGSGTRRARCGMSCWAEHGGGGRKGQLGRALETAREERERRGRWAGLLGRTGKEATLPRAELREREREKGWAGLVLGWVSYFLVFSTAFSISILVNSNIFEFKFKFEFTLTLNQKNNAPA